MNNAQLPPRKPNAQILGQTKFCVDCAHHAQDAEGLHRCKTHEFTDIVTGLQFNPPCEVMRHQENAPCCGNAALFQPKLIG